MELEFHTLRVERIALDGETRLKGGVLFLDREALVDRLREDPRLAQVEVETVHPGESARIIHVLDAVEPRAKTVPRGAAFPGLTGPPTMAGSGRTVRLAGAAVILTGRPVGAEDPAFWQEGVIEMSGPAAVLCPLSMTANLVVSVVPVSSLSPEESGMAMRLAGYRAAEYVAVAVADNAPDAVERLGGRGIAGSLPRVAGIIQLEASGAGQPTFLYGMNVEGLLPTLLDPKEVLDGALVGSSFHLPSFRNCTYLFQSHALVRELMRRHGRELNFIGIVVARALWPGYEDKCRSAAFTAKLLRRLDAAGAVITLSHGGHGVSDVVLTAQACELEGIRVATVMFEMAGEGGFDFSLVQSPREAEPLVSTGNIDDVLSLPAVERVVGGSEIQGVGGHAGTRQWAAGECKLPVRHLFAANDPAGGGRLTAREG